MNLRMAEDESDDSTPEIHIPSSDINWDMLDKSKFFFLGAALFSGVSAALYPIVLLKTRQQVSIDRISCFKTAITILRLEGPRGFYRGLCTSLMGTIPARALYMTALETTKSSVGTAAVKLGFSDSTAATVSNAAAGLSAAVAAQLIWTPIDVVSQRLMIQGGNKLYNNGMDAFRKIMYREGMRGLYRGFGISLMTYAPSNAVWWGSYCLSQRIMLRRRKEDGQLGSRGGIVVVGAQGLSAAVASGLSAIVTMPLDTIKTRLQVQVQVHVDVVVERELLGNGISCWKTRSGSGSGPTMRQTVRDLMREGGLGGCYRGLGPRWASMSMSAATMITTYEFIKRLSAKNNHHHHHHHHHHQLSSSSS